MSDTPARRHRLARLRHAVWMLAQPANTQLASFPGDANATHELVWSVRDSATLALVRERQALTDEQWRLLTDLDSHLYNFHYFHRSGAEIWSDEALGASPEWISARRLARQALASFGWEKDGQPPPSPEVVPIAEVADVGGAATPAALPRDLRHAVERAYAALAESPRFELRPVYRLAIYQAFGSPMSDVGHQARVRLAVLAAQLVSPIWQEERPFDPLPRRMLVLAEMVVAGRIDREIARDEAGVAWDSLDRLGAAMSRASYGCFWAGMAAVDAALTALGERMDFEEFVGTQGDRITNQDLDPWTSDVALWAMLACADHPDGPPDADRQRHFWDWWLGDAVARAWGSVSAPQAP